MSLPSKMAIKISTFKCDSKVEYLLSFNNLPPCYDAYLVYSALVWSFRCVGDH